MTKYFIIIKLIIIYIYVHIFFVLSTLINTNNYKLKKGTCCVLEIFKKIALYNKIICQFFIRYGINLFNYFNLILK